MPLSFTRTALRKRHGTRLRCRALVERFGLKDAFRGPPLRTILMRNVVDAGTAAPLAEHLWFTCGKWSFGLAPGDVVEFDARVGDYVKGYQGRREDVYDVPVSRDWKLQRPTKVLVLPRMEPAK